MKYYVAEIHYCSTTPWDSFTAGIYSTLEKAISALEKWVIPDGGKLEMIECKDDSAHFNIFFSEEDDVYCSIEPWELDVDFPDAF